MWIFITLCLATISYVGNAATGVVLDGDDKQHMLDAHNAARDAISECTATSRVGDIDPAKNTLEHLEWDDTLANLAKQKAEQCHYDHGTTPSGWNLKNKFNGKTPGENLACRSISPGIPNPSGAFVIATNQWIGAELNRYKSGVFGQVDSNNRGNCKWGGWTKESPKCAHYTQAIWEETTKIGCAYITVAECGGTITNTAGCELMTVCLYDPAGNTIGQYPYETSSSCGSGGASNEWINFGYEEDEDAEGGDGGNGHQVAVIAVIVVLVVLFCVLGGAGYWFWRRKSLRGKVEFNDDIGIDDEVDEDEEDGVGKETETGVNEVEIELNAETRE